MDPLWITVAFLFGFLMRQIGLPPLVGYLVAGFVLNAAGVVAGGTLQTLSDLGVTLLLFTIGLKLRLRSLARPEVWAGATLHMGLTTLALALGLYGLGAAGFALLAGLDFRLCLLIAFTLSFSSTVFAVKALEERGEMASLHGRVSIGILIVQDLVAVLFLTLSSGKIPSPWALTIPLALVVLRPLLGALMNRCGHGELLVLLGLFMALVVGATGFEQVGLKPDLGALVLGILMAGHPKAPELAKSLLGFKELFLVGFFLTIGLSGTPSLGALATAAVLVVAVPLKVALFFTLLTRFRLRARTSLLTSFSLANYSEFGLIVGAVGATHGWLPPDWLVVIAIALSITFVLASPLNTAANAIYEKLSDRLKPFQTATRHPEDEPIDPGPAQIVIFGMGRIGRAAYDYLRQQHGDVVIGVDFDMEAVEKNRRSGRNVILGDPTDLDFWERAAGVGQGKARKIVLATSEHSANLEAARLLTRGGFTGFIAATAQFDDQVEELLEAGVHAAYNLYAEAGTGFAEHVHQSLNSLQPTPE